MGICSMTEKKKVNIVLPLKRKKSRIIFRETNDNYFESTNQNSPRSQEINPSPTSTPKNKMLVSIDSSIFINQSILDPETVYSKEKILGHGSYGTVYLVKHKQLSKYFAMKTIKKNPNKKKELEILNNEIKILKSLDHPNILKIKDFYETNT